MRDLSQKRGQKSQKGRETDSRLSRPSCLSCQKSWLARAREVFDIEIAGLAAVRDSLGPSFVEAIRLISDCVSSGGIVVVTGVGKSLHVAEKMSAIFSSTGTRSFVLNPVQAMHGDLGMTSAKDLLIALSFSGESAEVNNLIPAVRRHGLKVIALTGNADSTLAKLADLHLPIPCGKEACPFGMAPTTSTTATMAMGDALAMVMVDARKFSLEEYAGNHPAGAIGRALVLKVSDVMRTGERLATVAPTATVLEAALAMTAAQGGSAIVVGKKGELKGIFTDGDLRRVMVEGSRDMSDGSDRRQRRQKRDQEGHETTSCPSRHSRLSCQVLSSPVSAFMTARPLFVRDTAYAADLLKIFEKKHIDDLPVCDAEGRVVGLVDLQDLPKMKVL